MSTVVAEEEQRGMLQSLVQGQVTNDIVNPKVNPKVLKKTGGIHGHADLEAIMMDIIVHGGEHDFEDQEYAMVATASERETKIAHKKREFIVMAKKGFNTLKRLTAAGSAVNGIVLTLFKVAETASNTGFSCAGAVFNGLTAIGDVVAWRKAVREIKETEADASVKDEMKKYQVCLVKQARNNAMISVISATVDVAGCVTDIATSGAGTAVTTIAGATKNALALGAKLANNHMCTSLKRVLESPNETETAAAIEEIGDKVVIDQRAWWKPGKPPGNRNDWADHGQDVLDISAEIVKTTAIKAVDFAKDHAEFLDLARNGYNALTPGNQAQAWHGLELIKGDASIGTLIESVSASMFD